jgi:hypothetical protein
MWYQSLRSGSDNNKSSPTDQTLTDKLINPFPLLGPGSIANLTAQLRPYFRIHRITATDTSIASLTRD